MDTDLMHKGLVGLAPGEFLRLPNPRGRYVGVVRGSVWITQDGVPADRVIGGGESFRFDRDGLALVTPLGGAAKLVLEDGLAPQKGAKWELATIDWDAFHERLPEYDRRARRLRAEAMAEMFAGFVRALQGLWRMAAGRFAAGLSARQTARELRGLSDHFLRDIGLRRDQIDCTARTIPC